MYSLEYDDYEPSGNEGRDSVDYEPYYRDWEYTDIEAESDMTAASDVYPHSPCQCEHASHFKDLREYDPNQHEYLMVEAGDQTAIFVGKICDDCANGHYADLLTKGDEA